VYKKIIVALDGSSTANLALTEAIALARHHKAQLRIVHVVNRLLFAPTVEIAGAMAQLRKAQREEGKQLLAAAKATAFKHRVQAQTVLLAITGDRAAAAIVKDAGQWPADLVVMGTHGRRGINRLMMGSDVEEVIRTCPAPVLVVRAPRVSRK
jgi:nucleotide-binding universal stress UspA family protein